MLKFPILKNILLVAMLLWVGMSSTVFAQMNQPQDPGPPPVDVCDNNLLTYHGNIAFQPQATFDSWALTQKVVNCLQGSLIFATEDMLQVISDYMVPIFGIMVVFALIVLGARIMNGDRELVRTLMGFSFRLGLIWMFFYNLGGLTDYIFLIEDQLVNMVTGGGGYSPWQKIDVFIGKIFGFGPQIVLFQGLLGLMGGALVSSTVGMILFIAGLMAIVDVLTFILSVLFTYLTAYVIMGFMIIIAPFIIPLALFMYTEWHFQKWLAMLIAAMLTPIMLFAFLYTFMDVFNILIANIFNTLGFPCGDPTHLAQCDTVDFKAFWKLNQPLFSWLVPSDPSFDQLLTIVTNENMGDPAVQSNILPTARRAMNTSVLVTPGIDFGQNNIGMTQSLVFQFITLWIYASLMKSMVTKIPDIAASIAQTVSGISLEPVSVKRMARETVQDAGLGTYNMAAYQLGRSRGA